MIVTEENNYIKLWVEEDILYCMYKKDCIVTIDAAKEIVSFRMKFQKGKSYKVMLYTSLMGMVTPEARQYLSQEGYQGVTRLAMITNSPISTLMGNLFVSINKPPRPTRLFKTREEALKWLKNDGN
jgi:hypothetical protein